jgi:hypothetical protein
MSVNSKLSAALKGNQNAKGPHKKSGGARAFEAGMKVAGAAESAYKSTVGAVKGAIHTAKYDKDAGFKKKVSDTVYGAKEGYKAGKIEAAKSTTIDEAGGKLARKAYEKVESGAKKVANSKPVKYAGAVAGGVSRGIKVGKSESKNAEETFGSDTLKNKAKRTAASIKRAVKANVASVKNKK